MNSPSAHLRDVAAPASSGTAHLLPEEPVRFGLDGRIRNIGHGPEDLATHRRRWGPRPPATGANALRVLAALEAVDLTGHGGGHFPVATKWRTVRDAGQPAVVVANGAEGEPLSFKDAALLQLRPHLVLDGVACAAETVGARDVVVWLHEGADATRFAVDRAIADRRAAGLVEPAVRVAVGPARYLTGESSSVVQALSGGLSLPMFVRTPSAISGVDGRPTLINNVETLARVAIVARDGDGYRPSTLLTVADREVRTVLEVEPHVSLGEVIEASVAWSHRWPPQALLVGGYGGTWLPWADARDLACDHRTFASRGLSIGAGVVLPVAATSCGLGIMASTAGYLAAHSAGQCGPCFFGLRAVAKLMDDLADYRLRRRDQTQLERFLTEIDGRGACHHPDGAVRMVASGLHAFRDDVRSHVRNRRCLHEASRA